MHSKGSPGGEGPRTHVQGTCLHFSRIEEAKLTRRMQCFAVFANSLMATILTLAHAYQLRSREAAYADAGTPNPEKSICFSWGGDVLVVGIIANYAAVAADTFSSELGILAKSDPRLITSLSLRKVPRGTNGGVTLLGLGAGLFGSMVIVATTMVFLPACSTDSAPAPGGGTPWTLTQRQLFMGFLVVWGALGSVLDSFLGATLQRSVRDARSGKIIEGEGGNRVLVSGAAHGGEGDIHPSAERKKSDVQQPSRVIESGWDLLDNNDVNFLMASVMSVGAMGVASWYWGVPLESVLKP